MHTLNTDASEDVASGTGKQGKEPSDKKTSSSGKKKSIQGALGGTLSLALIKVVGLQVILTLWIFYFVGHFMAMWLIRKTPANSIWTKALYASNFVSWMVPGAGMCTGAASLVFARGAALPAAIGIVCMIMSVISATVGVFQEATSMSNHINRAVELNQAGKYQDSIVELDAVINSPSFDTVGGPLKAVYFDARGMNYDSMENYKKALAEYSEAIRLDPHLAVAFRHRGEVQQFLKNDSAALDDFSEAIRLDPTQTEAYHGRALIYFKK